MNKNMNNLLKIEKMDAKSIKNPSKNRSRKKVRINSKHRLALNHTVSPRETTIQQDAPQVIYKSIKTTEGNLQKVTYLRRKTKGGQHFGGKIPEGDLQRVFY